jgi:hypothetical protein
VDDIMKKLIAGMVTMAIALAGVCGFMVGQGVNAVQQVEAQQVQEIPTMPFMEVREVAIDKEPINNPYSYVVTEIVGDEINGIAIDNVSFENAGVVLSKDLDNLHDIETGDIVQVTYGVALDDIQNAVVMDNDYLTEEQFNNLPHMIMKENGERAFRAEDGTYVPESFYYTN